MSQILACSAPLVSYPDVIQRSKRGKRQNAITNCCGTSGEFRLEPCMLDPDMTGLTSMIMQVLTNVAQHFIIIIEVFL